MRVPSFDRAKRCSTLNLAASNWAGSAWTVPALPDWSTHISVVGVSMPSIREALRMIATARILMPTSLVRLSAGRSALTREAQILCFLAGANSIFYGDKLLTTGNPDWEADQRLLGALGIRTC